MEDQEPEEQITVAPDREITVSEVLDRNLKLLLTTLSIIVIVGGAILWVQSQISEIKSHQTQTDQQAQWQAQEVEKRFAADEHHTQDMDGKIDSMRMDVAEIKYRQDDIADAVGAKHHKPTP